MITLGIETSCDETAVAVVRGSKTILSSVVRSSLHEHRRYGGVVPEIASRAHLETLLPCLELALKKAKVRRENIGLIAVTAGPGLMGALLVGQSAAKALALAWGKPLVGVDHVLAHIHAGFLAEPTLKYPVLGLAVSGGHTLLLRMDSPRRVRILGRTLDDASGEAFDKVAKLLGLEYPGGPEIDRISRGADPTRFSFKRPFLSKESLDFSFSGLKTAVLYKVKELERKAPLTRALKTQLAAGFQEAVCDVLVGKTLAAAAREGLKSVVIGGGVSANSRLRRLLTRAASGARIRAVFPPPALCQDNAAMIAAYGAALYGEGRRDRLDLAGYSELSTTEVPHARKEKSLARP